MTDRDARREVMLQTYASVLAPHSAIYCSAPITSGRRYIEWLSKPGGSRRAIDDLSAGERELHRTHVIDPNRNHAREIVERLRQRQSKPVIDPTVVGPISDWRQSDWIDYWEQVIARFVSEVVFTEGWEYSYGCTHEFLFAVSKGMPTLDEAGKRLSPSEGGQRLAAALPRLRQSGIEAGRFETMLSSLRGMTR